MSAVVYVIDWREVGLGLKLKFWMEPKLPTVTVTYIMSYLHVSRFLLANMLGTVVSDFGLIGSVLPVMMFAGLSVIVMGVFGSWRPSGFPPGPKPLPFIGNLKGE